MSPASQLMLLLAALLVVCVGAAHSYLGERLILMRLFRRCALPPVFGSADMTRRTLRVVWHLATVAWLGLAAVLVLLAWPGAGTGAIGLVVAATFLVHGLVGLIGSRGKHLSWIAFLAIALLAGLAVLG